jgi:hypothetical protein
MLLYWKSAYVQSTIYSNRLVSSLSVVAINNALVSAQWAAQPQPHSNRPRLGCQLTRRLGGSNAGARPTARDTLQLCHNKFP